MTGTFLAESFLVCAMSRWLKKVLARQGGSPQASEAGLA
jgi:hypothetical protein